MTITGTSGTLTRTATVALTVGGPAPVDFVNLALPASETITIGSIGTISVTATATDGYTGPVNVSASTLPTGVTDEAGYRGIDSRSSADLHIDCYGEREGRDIHGDARW